MPKIVKKSFYALEISVDPGGTRKAEVHIHNSIAAIQNALEAELEKAGNIYLLTWYGEDVTLQTYQSGRQTQKINLLPFIRINIKRYPEMWFNDKGQLQGIKFRDNDHLPGWASHPGKVVSYETFLNQMLKGRWQFTTTVDWNAIPVEVLQGDLAQKGDHLALNSSYGSERIRVGYGFNELEEGEYEDETVGENLELDEDEEQP